ncbi:hypothetical protein [Candidatus Chlamydia corallus]|uniref:hypothetical protein n=1 Tax=Candidatus Chlamydia corallus TaxID=2038470 RepID=UPI000C2F8F07|nr:hypothetical protein [Candidatus Chlamydia corallus]
MTKIAFHNPTSPHYPCEKKTKTTPVETEGKSSSIRTQIKYIVLRALVLLLGAIVLIGGIAGLALWFTNAVPIAQPYQHEGVLVIAIIITVLTVGLIMLLNSCWNRLSEGAKKEKITKQAPS